MSVFHTIEEAITQIGEATVRREQFAKKLDQLPVTTFEKNKDYPEGIRTVPVVASTLNMTLMGVDSGFVNQEWFLLDVLLVRATGVINTYKNDQLVNTQYEPQAYHFPTPYLSSQSLAREDVGPSVSIVRLRQEWQRALEGIQKYSPQACFIDGSLLPQFMDKPGPKSPLRKEFDHLCRLVEMVYQTAQEKNCLLIGCVEDSRAKRWGEMITEKSGVEVSYSDPVILSHWLKKNERTGVLSYTTQANDHPILSEISPTYRESVHVLYLRPSEQDVPLRVEFLCAKSEDITMKANLISSIVLRQSQLHPEYAYPAVLIEADLRSKLTNSEIQMIHQKISDRVTQSAGLFRRRDRRPFG